jgi:hypothetical protein
VYGNTLTFATLPAAASFDFTLSVSPSTVSVKQGDAANYQISITYNYPSYSGTTITVQVSGLGPGMNYQIIPTPPGLRVSTSQSTPTSTYTITLVGYANGVTHQTSAILIVQQAMTRYTIDWALSNPSLSPPSPKVGDQVTFNIIASQHSSDWPDSLSVSVNVKLDGAPFDFLWIYQNQPGPIPPGTTKTATTKPWTASAGTHSVTWTLVFFGGNESVILADPTENNEASLEFSVAVQAPDFRIDASPLAQTVTQRQTTSYSVNVVRLYGFNSQVSLSVSGLPAGATGIFSVQSSTPDYSSTLTVTIPGNSPTGSFTLTISGSGGGITRTANVVLAINPSQTVSETATATTSASGLEAITSNAVYLLTIALGLAVVALAVALTRKRSRPPQYLPRPSQTRVPAAEMRYCANCGAPLEFGKSFCGACGQRAEI